MILGFSFFGNVRGQVQQESSEAFLDFAAFGLRIQVNATAQARPTENITVILVLTSLTEVHINYFNLSIFGFLNGTDRILMANKSDVDFWLNSTSYSYNWTFTVPEWVSGKTYGDIRMAHLAIYGPAKIDYEEFPCGFYMTDVENVYLEELQSELNNLTQKYEQLNQSYIELQQNLTDALRGNANSLDSARTVITALLITTVFFVATTLYLVIRKPREY
jgi:hypothetical protein